MAIDWIKIARAPRKRANYELIVRYCGIIIHTTFNNRLCLNNIWMPRYVYKSIDIFQWWLFQFKYYNNRSTNNRYLWILGQQVLNIFLAEYFMFHYFQVDEKSVIRVKIWSDILTIIFWSKSAPRIWLWGYRVIFGAQKGGLSPKSIASNDEYLFSMQS